MKKLYPLIIILLLLIACDHNKDFASLVNPTIADFIQKEYRGATIRNAEYDGNGLYEVEIRHDSHIKDVYFDKENYWVYTTWDVRTNDLPTVVKNAIEAQYPGYRIDDVDYVESVEKSYYKVELDKGELEQTIYISKNGEYNN